MYKSGANRNSECAYSIVCSALLVLQTMNSSSVRSNEMNRLRSYSGISAFASTEDISTSALRKSIINTSSTENSWKAAFPIIVFKGTDLPNQNLCAPFTVTSCELRTLTWHPAAQPPSARITAASEPSQDADLMVRFHFCISGPETLTDKMTEEDT